MAAQEEEEDLKSQYYGNPDWEHYERIGSFELLFPKSHGLERFEQMRQTLREEGWERLQEDRKLDLVRREYFKKPQEEREQPPPFPPITCDPRTGELLPPKCPPTSPKCKVKVKVLKGSSLMVADITGDADPYVKVFFQGKCVGQTKVIKNTLNPVWEETIPCEVDSNLVRIGSPPSSELTFEVWDKDVFSDDYMGKGVLPLVGLTKDEFVLEVPLETEGKVSFSLSLGVDVWRDDLNSFRSDRLYEAEMRMKLLVDYQYALDLVARYQIRPEEEEESESRLEQLKKLAEKDGIPGVPVGLEFQGAGRANNDCQIYLREPEQKCSSPSSSSPPPPPPLCYKEHRMGVKDSSIVLYTKYANLNKEDEGIEWTKSDVWKSRKLLPTNLPATSPKANLLAPHLAIETAYAAVRCDNSCTLTLSITNDYPPLLFVRFGKETKCWDNQKQEKEGNDYEGYVVGFPVALIRQGFKLLKEIQETEDWPQEEDFE